MRQILIILLLTTSFYVFSQDCSKIKVNVDSDYSYYNENEGISLPFNSDWSIIIEDKQAIIVALTEKSQSGFASIIKIQHATKLESAHELSDLMIDNFFIKAAVKIKSKTLTKTYIRNIKALQIEFDYDVNNLDETIPMKGLAFMIEKGYFTYMFMFNCQPHMKKCYFPLFNNIMKNSFFEPDWFGKNN